MKALSPLYFLTIVALPARVNSTPQRPHWRQETMTEATDFQEILVERGGENHYNCRNMEALDGAAFSVSLFCDGSCVVDGRDLLRGGYP